MVFRAYPRLLTSDLVTSTNDISKSQPTVFVNRRPVAVADHSIYFEANRGMGSPRIQIVLYEFNDQVIKAQPTEKLPELGHSIESLNELGCHRKLRLPPGRWMLGDPSYRRPAAETSYRSTSAITKSMLAMIAIKSATMNPRLISGICCSAGNEGVRTRVRYAIVPPSEIE